MKRIQEKVKDIVEVHSYQSLRDFMADANETLATYHFTDGTSDLMAKWIDQIGSVSNGRGAAFALAGYRGVGKSHFLAVLGWLVSTPELRSRVSDSHVGNSAQRLLRRHYPIAHVRRGTNATLIDELKDAIAGVCGVSAAELSDSAEDLLEVAGKFAADLPFVLLIDTAFERGSRVTRDDGAALSQIAEAARSRNVFVGVALDDDIAGADGLNSSIVRTFTIDYLDQEHLYKVVNANIFPKKGQMQPVLYDIYQYFKEVLPGFRWSEQRFLSLYPLHPVILEVAPFVRLYVHDFALLAFASAAGTRIMGRPANSLIALDEVFDSVENNLRKIDELREAFEAYDRLNSEVVGEIPVMQRLQAKLILKALLLLSLEGEGTTANEISSAMLIIDETDPEHAERSISELIRTFSERIPGAITIYAEEGREVRYGFKVSGKDDLNKALAEASINVSPDVIPAILKRLFLERFTDSAAVDGPTKAWADCQAVWRGGLRRGRVFIGSNAASANKTDNEFIDWEAFLEFSTETPAETPNDASRIQWRPAEISPEETETLLRYYTLSTQTDLREKFGDQLRASVHAHTISVGKILDRVLLEDGKIVIDGFDYNFTEEARAAETLSELFSIMLEPMFETRYPEHPQFGGRLDMAEVAALVADLYSENRQNLAEVQQLARSFAFPLGIVRSESGVFVPETEDALAKLPAVEMIMRMVPKDPSQTVSLRTIYGEMKKPPYGLVREAQHLILSALVAQRRVEFVTTKGDRINRRSLDLKLIWDDIAGVAVPAGSTYSGKKLLQWAMLVSNTEGIASLDAPDDREKLKAGFKDWLENWRSRRVLERFNEIPDEVLNTKIWRISARVTKNAGSLAGTIEAMLSDSISFDEGLHRIADVFSDSPEAFSKARVDVETLEHFMNGVGPREDIRTYLSVAEHTGEPDIESARDELMKLVDKSYFEPGEAVNRELKYVWDRFRKAFGEYFAGNHDVVMRSHVLQEKFDEIKRGDKWWEFQNLSVLPIFDNGFWAESKVLFRQLKQLDCNTDVRSMLNKQPFCECSFSLGKIEYWERMPELLLELITKGLAEYRKTLQDQKATLIPMVEKFAAGSAEKDVQTAASAFVEKLNGSDANFSFSVMDLKILQEILESSTKSTQKRVSTFDMSDIMSDEELDRELGDWIEDLPKEQELMNI